jgi:hypothetical protein
MSGRVATFSGVAIITPFGFETESYELGVPHFSRFSRSGPPHSRSPKEFALMPCA